MVVGTKVLRWAMVPALCIATVGCGGSGGGGDGGTPPPPPPPPAEVIALLEATMLGSEESTVIDADARAVAVAEILDDGTVRFAGTGEADWSGDVVGLHVHRGVAGVDGPIVIDLLSGGATVDTGTHTVTGTVTTTAALAAEIAATPGDFYVNVHTSAAPLGLARGQLQAFAGREIHALLLGEEESVVVDPNARGAAAVHIDGERAANFVIAMAQPLAGELTMGHIHFGPAGVDGGIALDFDVPTSTLDVAAGTRTGSATAPLPLISRLSMHPDQFYVNVHTAAAPAGIARGQVTNEVVEFWAILQGSLETTVVNPNARGGMTLQLTSFTEGTVHYATPHLPHSVPGGDIESIIMAHVHDGDAGIDGPIVIPLHTGADHTVSAPTGSAEGSVTLTQSLFARILADPDGFYCNLHTGAAPAGLMRGQLTQEPVRFFAELSGANETTVVDPNASGVLESLLVRGVFEASFSIRMIDPPATDLIMGHIHDGVAGTDGPILINLLEAADLQISGNFLTGSVLFTGRTFARMMAFPEGFYCNVHTAAAPAGIAREQLTWVSGDTPPAALTYTTPVTYVTGAAITANIPTNAGGTIESYSVSPALPAGLTLNTVTGVISGTPTAVAAAADYTVTGTNDAGSTQATVNITVNEGPPLTLSYTTPVTYVEDTAITPNTPTSTGGAITGYSVSPSLPSGLTLNTTTGVISGTPTDASSAADFVVTGSNGAGSVMATVNITVTAGLQPPSNLSYSTPVSYPTGSEISPNTPTVTGSVTSWSISPSLPAGLSFSTTTGVISGTPTAVTSAANYTVTASNAAGSTTATVNITVTLGAPANLSYSNNPNIGYVTGGSFASMTPSSTGGAVASYSIDMALPSGISLNTTTGVISGSPTAQSSQTTYTVTATNATGSTTAQITITILP
jgi:hypothetical protein